MKNYLVRASILLMFIFCIISCNMGNKNKKPVRVEKPITKIDKSIDSTNSYNNLFLDSAMVNTYLRNDSTLTDVLKNRILSFYNSRNFQYAWFSSNGLAEQTNAFWNMLMNYYNYSNDSTVYNKELNKKMNRLFESDSLIISNDSIHQKIELDLTKYLYLYAENEYKEDMNFNMKSLEWYVPRKKLTLNEMLNMAIERKKQFANENAPANTQYLKLREMLHKYWDISKAGGWDSIRYNKDISAIGYSGDEIVQLKRRLKKEGYISGEDSLFTNVYDSTLFKTLQRVKIKYGYKPDQVITKMFIADLNIPVEERLQQILINMNRMRWIPTETNDSGRAILVNIPEFKLHMYEKGKPAWDMDVIVGKEAHGTTLFSGNLNTIVFSPYWNIPPSIVRNEILPKMKRNSHYLARNNMEIVSAGAIPTIRQKPGPSNSLGRVKFLFPNSHNIYMHDSPAKSLFNTDKRTYSHGCVRLKEPAKMAQYLLNDTTKWNAEKVNEAMNANSEKFVRLKQSVPVMITYFTAWVNGEDGVSFREDIYGHDERAAFKMFLNPKPTTRHKDKSRKK